MKKLIFIAALGVCVTACTKQNDVKPVSSSLKNSKTMSGGGDKRPTGTYD